MTDSSAARDRLRSMALSLATGSGPIVDPRSFNAAIDAYGDARLAEQPADVASEVSLLRAAIGRGRRLARAFEVSGNEFIADQIRTALDLDEPATPVLTPYRRLLARLEADRAGHLRAAGQTTDGTLRTAGSSYAAALHQAAVAAVTEFEGAEAAQAYAQQTSGGEAGEVGDDSLNSAELTAEEAQDLAADLGLELYRTQDALAFVEECCVIADREGRTVTTAAVREWLKGARCGRQLAAATSLEESAAEFKSGAATLNSPAATALGELTPVEIANHVGRAIWALKTPSPTGSEHYCSGWDNGLDAATDAARDAVLAALPAPADRATMLREAADMIYAEFTGPDLDRYARYAAGYLRRMADEAQQAGEGGSLKRAHVALAEQAGRDQAALTRVRALHDNLAASSELTSPDDSITRGAAARRIAAALDGVTDQPAN